MLVILLIPTVGIAFMDVVIDALMVQYGQPIGMTGRFQSIQWSASYAATVLTGSTSGWLCKHGYEAWGFGICALASLLMFVTALSFVHERGLPERFALPVPESPRKSLKRVVSSKPLWLTVGFLMCWNFNPFSSVIQQVYMLKHLGLDEQFYGHTLSVGAMGSVIGSVAYGFYCRHVNLRKLMHGSIGLGILTTCLYWGLSGRYSALVIFVCCWICVSNRKPHSTRCGSKALSRGSSRDFVCAANVPHQLKYQLGDSIRRMEFRYI